jgi:hypothetical protein
MMKNKRKPNTVKKGSIPSPFCSHDGPPNPLSPSIVLLEKQGDLKSPVWMSVIGLIIMSRYDLANNKTKKKKVFVDATDTIVKYLQNHQKCSDDIVGVQTPIRGKSVLFRGPGGYQVSVPLRFVSVHHSETSAGEYELHLKIPAPVAHSLSKDIMNAQEDPNERLRLSGINTDERSMRNNFE